MCWMNFWCRFWAKEKKKMMKMVMMMNHCHYPSALSPPPPSPIIILIIIITTTTFVISTTIAIIIIAIKIIAVVGLWQAVNKLKGICASNNLDMSAASLAWVFQQEAVPVAIVGASKPEQIEANSKVIKLSPVSGASQYSMGDSLPGLLCILLVCCSGRACDRVRLTSEIV